MHRSHRALALALLVTATALVAACDNPTVPVPLSLNSRTASDLGDTLACGNRGYTIIQGVVACNPNPG